MCQPKFIQRFPPIYLFAAENLYKSQSVIVSIKGGIRRNFLTTVRNATLAENGFFVSHTHLILIRDNFSRCACAWYDQMARDCRLIRKQNIFT